MKRLLFTLLAMCLTIMTHAQATSLIVDCQYAGWLSTLVDVKDQPTLQNLKITGRINADDFAFIAKLNNKGSLVGRLDLSEVKIVGLGDIYTADDYLSANIIAGNPSSGKLTIKPFSCLVLPYSVKKVADITDSFTSAIDTLVFAPDSINYVNGHMIGGKFRHLILGDKVDSIPNYAAFEYTNSNSYAVSDMISIVNWNEMKEIIRYVGYRAFYGTNWRPDSLYLPCKIDTWETKTFEYKNGEHVFVGENIKTINGRVYGSTSYPSYTVNWKSSGIDSTLYVHLASDVPPKLEYFTTFSKNTIIYVPYGKGEDYKSDKKWSKFKIVEEEPIHVERVELSDKQIVLSKIGETYQLQATVYPADAQIRDVEYVSSDKAVCVVAQDGLVVATGNGKCTIVARAKDGGIPNVCQVTVDTEATGIEVVNDNRKVKGANVIYDLQGRRVYSPGKGIYIIEGRKRLMK